MHINLTCCTTAVGEVRLTPSVQNRLWQRRRQADLYGSKVQRTHWHISLPSGQLVNGQLHEEHIGVVLTVASVHLVVIYGPEGSLTFATHSVHEAANQLFRQRTTVVGRHVHEPVGVDVRSEFNLRHALGHRSLPLQDPFFVGMVVFSSISFARTPSVVFKPINDGDVQQQILPAPAKTPRR